MNKHQAEGGGDRPVEKGDWDPYNVWAKRIRDQQPQRNTSEEDSPTGSWRPYAVWENLINKS